jgi:hypothetical protein
VSNPESHRRIQFRLAGLLAAPFMVLPLFLGLSTGTQRPALGNSNLQYNSIALLFYVIVFCWITIRQFDRLNDFRRFPFRGSLLLGSVAGTLAAVQFAFGLAIADVIEVHDQSSAVITAQQVRDLCGMLICSVFAGAFFGGYFGLVAGGIYCVIRYLSPHRSIVVAKSQRPRRNR